MMKKRTKNILKITSLSVVALIVLACDLGHPVSFRDKEVAAGDQRFFLCIFHFMCNQKGFFLLKV